MQIQLSPTILDFEIGSSTEPEADCFGLINGPLSSFNPPVSASSPALGPKVHATTPSFFVCAEVPDSSCHACVAWT